MEQEQQTPKRADVQPPGSSTASAATEPCEAGKTLAATKTGLRGWWSGSAWQEKLAWGWLVLTTVWLIAMTVGCQRWWSLIAPAMLTVGAVVALVEARKRRLNKQD